MSLFVCQNLGSSGVIWSPVEAGNRKILPFVFTVQYSYSLIHARYYHSIVPFPVPRSDMHERARDLYVDMTSKHIRLILFLNLMHKMHEYRSEIFVQSRDDDPVLRARTTNSQQ